MSSEKCSPHTEHVDMIMVSYVCIFVFFVYWLDLRILNYFFEKNIPTPIEKKTNSGMNLYGKIS